jgi:hypothetical protein
LPFYFFHNFTSPNNNIQVLAAYYKTIGGNFPEKEPCTKAAYLSDALAPGANLGNYKSLRAKLPIKNLAQLKRTFAGKKPLSQP